VKNAEMKEDHLDAPSQLIILPGVKIEQQRKCKQYLKLSMLRRCREDSLIPWGGNLPHNILLLQTILFRSATT
jgi:hypothetical protein